ncbi:MAG: hypothetical protein ABSG74_07280 [Candidatus Bathyarchaeia archaeon]
MSSSGSLDTGDIGEETVWAKMDLARIIEGCEKDLALLRRLARLESTR